MDHSLKSMVGRRGVRILVAGAFTVFIVYLIWRNVSAEVFSNIFQNLDYGSAVVTLVLYIAIAALRALRFTTIGARVSFPVAFHISAIHSALLRVMPFRSGELAYAVLLKRHGGGGFTEGVASIVLIRVLDLAAVFPLGALAIGSFISESASALSIGLLVLFGLVFGVMFFALEKVFRGLASRLDGRSTDEKRLRHKLARICRTMAEAYNLPLRQRILLVAITAVHWGILLVWFFFAFHALGAVDTFGQGLAASVLGIAGSILPLSLVGSFGPMEGGIALGLTTVGHTREVALASALLVSALTFICNWAVAIPSWIALLLEAPKGAEPSKSRSRIRWASGALLFSSVGAVLLLLKYSYYFETNDQFQYLLLPYRYIYEGFLQGDWFTWRVSRYHVTFSWLVRGLHALLGEGGFPVGVFLLHMGVLAGLCYGILALARALRCHWAAAGVAVLVVAFVNRLGIGGAIVTHGLLLPADMALPPFIIACAHWVRGRRLRAGLFLGLAGFLHANFALLGPMVFAVPEIARLVKTRDIKGPLYLAGGYLVVAWPTLAVTVSAFMTGDSVPQALSILFEIRSPHHYAPSLADSRELWFLVALAVGGLPLWLDRDRETRPGGVLILVFVAAQIIAFAGMLLEINALVRLFLWRLTIPLMLLLAVGVGEVCVQAVRRRDPGLLLFALGAVILVLSFSGTGLVRLAPGVTLLGFGVLLPGLLPLLAAALVRRLVDGGKGRRMVIGLGAAAVIWAGIASAPGFLFGEKTRMSWITAAESWRAFDAPSLRKIKGDGPRKAVYRWIRRNTPEDSVFLIPPGTSDFRLGARRAAFVDWKCCPMKGEEILEWKRRMLAAMGTRRFPTQGYALHRVANHRYNARPLKALQRLARQERVTHVMVKGSPKTEVDGLEKLTKKSGYTIYRVVPGDPSERLQEK